MIVLDRCIYWILKEVDVSKVLKRGVHHNDDGITWTRREDKVSLKVTRVLAIVTTPPTDLRQVAISGKEKL
jgi:hypothetical protein